MSDLISRKALKAIVERHMDMQDLYLPAHFLDIADGLPTLDAVEVVRCCECIRRDICRTTNTWAVPPNDDWFCADGERKEVSE